MKNYSWDECNEKAMKIVKELLEAGHFGQDLMFIGMKLQHLGIYACHRNAEVYVKEHPLDEIIT